MKVKRGKPQVSLKPRASSKGGVASKLQAGKPPLTKINRMVEKNKHEWMQDLGRPNAREEFSQMKG